MTMTDRNGSRYDPRLHWDRQDTVIVLLVTLVYSVLALAGLGSLKAPQTFWQQSAYGEGFVLDLGSVHDDFSMLYYTGVSYRNFKVETSDDGVNWSDPVWAEVKEGQCYQWLYLVPSEGEGETAEIYRGLTVDSVQHLSGRYVRITAGTMTRSGSEEYGLLLGEVVFRDLVPVKQTAAGTDGEPFEFSTTVSGGVIPVTVLSHEGGNEASPKWSDPGLAVDEQDTLSGEPSWYNSTYFDEIYHARTAYELLHGQRVYEYTHPPLGKLLMSACIAIFGMTPFGWRLAGTLAGIAMLPGIYLLVKQLTKKTAPAAAAVALMALDLMHLAQTRIATIDSFPVLFIILSYFFMLRFMQRDLARKSGAELPAMLPDLALSGFFFALAISSKWIGAYAGAGLAVLLFWRLIALIHREVSAHAPETRGPVLKAAAIGIPVAVIVALLCRQFFLELGADAAAATVFGALPALLLHAVAVFVHVRIAFGPTEAWRYGWFRAVWVCLWCLLFFVAIPAVIYAVCFIPVFASEHLESVGAFLSRFVQEQVNIFNYHATPGLGMDHYYYTPWYEWPVMAKPMYYYAASYLPAGTSMSIFCLGNPAVWWSGQIALILLLPLWLFSLHADRRRGELTCDTRPECGAGFILLGFAAQFLPWVLVPRGTYIYHYFASIPFLIAAFAYAFHLMEKRWRELAWGIMVPVLVLSVLFFLVLLPYATGLQTPTWYLDIGSRLLNIYYR